MSELFANFRLVYVLVAVSLWGGWTIKADETEHEFSGIATKNAFGLKAPVVEKTEKSGLPPAAPSNIVLTGVASIEGRKMAFFTVSKPDEKEPKYLRLGENERDGALEVATINVETGQVQIRHNGRLELISFATHGAKASASASAPASAGPPRPPGIPGKPLSVTGSPVK